MVTYADKPWINRYDKGVRASLRPYPDHPLHDFLRQSAEKYPNRPLALTSASLPVIGRVKTTYTYREINQWSDALAVGLIEMGLQKGDRVALVMPNIAQFIIGFYAVLKAGGVVAAINPTYPPKKMGEMIQDSGAKLCITMSLFYEGLKGIQTQTSLEKIIVTNAKEYLPGMAKFLFTIAREKKEGHRVELKESDVWFQDVLKQYAGQKPNVEVKGEDRALFQYTGGTTGVSKAAVATHSALVANCLMCREWLMSGSERKPEEEIFLGAIPMFHVYGLVAVLSFAVSMGSMITLVPNAREIPDVVENIHYYKTTLFMGVPALFNAINNFEGVKAGHYSLASLRACNSGSAPLPPSTKLEFERLSGGILTEGFGMSEAPTATHVNPLLGENRTGSIGLPLPDMEMKIVDLEDGITEMAVGEPGELLMHGPQIMLGYHNMPTETQNVLRLHDDGKLWLYTGDIARMDEDGYFYIVDRKKDMALIGGFNVYPRRVEDILNEHPAVLEVGVAAVPHPNPEKVGQESLKAWVVIKPDMALTEQELIDFAAERLARYEIPTRIQFVEELPKTTVGKILRRELARMEIESREQAAQKNG